MTIATTARPPLRSHLDAWVAEINSGLALRALIKKAGFGLTDEQNPAPFARLGRKSKSISATYPSSNGFSSGNCNGFCVDSGQEVLAGQEAGRSYSLGQSSLPEALNAAHHPLALYPPQQIRTDSFSQAFFDYLRAIDQLLSIPRLLQQRSDLQAQLPRGAFSDRPICALVLALYCNMRTAEQFVYYLLAWHAACDMLHLYNDFACQFQVPYPGGAAHHSVHELGLQCERMGQSDKDTRAASNAIKAKLRTARQLLKEAALYQALGSGEDAAAVSIIEEQLSSRPW
ncbi:hypothetical protein QJQ45_000048 [Haematococcus lacustris]|nr:hypothetical protein QJQ45_000048 [Haematococcus lacustris]